MRETLNFVGLKHKVMILAHKVYRTSLYPQVSVVFTPYQGNLSLHQTEIIS